MSLPRLYSAAMNLRLTIRGGQYHALLFITTKSCETQPSQHELITSLPLFFLARHLVPLPACLFTYLHACFLPAFSPSPQCMFLYLRAWLAIRCSLARSLFLPLPGGFIIHADNSFHNRTENTKGTRNLKPFPRSLVHNAGLALVVVVGTRGTSGHLVYLGQFIRLACVPISCTCSLYLGVPQSLLIVLPSLTLFSLAASLSVFAMVSLIFPQPLPFTRFHFVSLNIPLSGLAVFAFLSGLFPHSVP